MRTQIISFNCILKNQAGQLISSTFNRDVLTAAAADEPVMLPGLVKGMQNLKKGEKRSIALKAEEAYGLYDPAKVILFPREELPKSIRKGDVVHLVGKSGLQRAYRVVELFARMASLDGNHPLAGQDLIFEIETLDARDATEQEINESSNTVGRQLLH